MSHRNMLKGACRILSQCQMFTSTCKAGISISGSAMHAAHGAGSSGLTGLLRSPITMRGTRAGVTQAPSYQPAFPMGFAASAISANSPLSILGSVAQHRGVSSTEMSEEGDGDDAEPTYENNLTANPQSSLAHPSKEDEPPDLRGARHRNERRAPGRRPAGGGGREGGEGDSGALELVTRAWEDFTRQTEPPRGPLPPIPPEVREAMYGHRWDRVLVDVRRSVQRTREGRLERYTAMVAVGNMAGIFGLGIGVAATAQLAVARANLDSLTKLGAVPLYRGHTLYHHVDHTYHCLKMRLMPRPEGWGLRCSSLLYELCAVAGLRNASIVMHGRKTNRFFVAQCFQEALTKQTTPHDGVEATGMYVREVYHRKELPVGLKRGVDVP